MGDYAIRLAVERDWPGILDIEEARYGPAGYSRYFVRMIPLLFARSCWVAEQDDTLMGYCLGAREDSAPDVGWLLSVAVLREYEDCGIGAALCSHCIEGLESQGVRSIRLTVEPQNGPALSLYHKLGFTVVAEKVDFFGAGQGRLLMGRETPP